MQTKTKLSIQPGLIFTLFAFVPLLLSGCGADDIIEEFYDPDGYKITSFDIYGTSDDIQNSNNNDMVQAPIREIENSGNFFIHWNTQNERQIYDVDIYVSADQNLSEQTDVNFFSNSCLGSTDCDRNPNSNLDCNFTGLTVNTIKCGRDFSGTDISNVVTGNVLTQGAYIIIKTCNVTEFSCGTSSHAVLFE